MTAIFTIIPFNSYGAESEGYLSFALNGFTIDHVSPPGWDRMETVIAGGVR